MRLCVNESGHEFYIAAFAATRCELAQKLGDPVEVKIDGAWHTYNIDDVYAEPAGRLDIAFMMIGGLIGLVAGPFGALFGALGGYLWGINENMKEERKVKIFNGCLTGGLHDAPDK